MTEVWNSGAAGGPCHPSYQFLAAGGVTHECVRQPQCVVCVMLTARGVDPTSLSGGTPKPAAVASKSPAQAWESWWQGGGGATEGLWPCWTRGHTGVSPPSPSREHTALRDLPLDGRRMRGSVLWICPCLSGQPWTALGKGKGLLLGTVPRWGGLRVNSVMAQLQERFGAM